LERSCSGGGRIEFTLQAGLSGAGCFEISLEPSLGCIRGIKFGLQAGLSRASSVKIRAQSDTLVSAGRRCSQARLQSGNLAGVALEASNTADVRFKIAPKACVGRAGFVEFCLQCVASGNGGVEVALETSLRGAGSVEVTLELALDTERCVEVALDIAARCQLHIGRIEFGLECRSSVHLSVIAGLELGLGSPGAVQVSLQRHGLRAEAVDLA